MSFHRAGVLTGNLFSFQPDTGEAWREETLFDEIAEEGPPAAPGTCFDRDKVQDCWASDLPPSELSTRHRRAGVVSTAYRKETAMSESTTRAPVRTVGRVGNVVADPELRFSPAGKPYVRFGIAVNPYVPKGEPKPEATFYEVTGFDSLAENIAATLSKGDRVVVVGRPEIQEWTSKDGQAMTTKKIIADGVGPDLRFATAKVAKTTKPRGEATVPADDEPF